MTGQMLDAVLAIERHGQLSPWSRLSFEESLTAGDFCRCLIEGEQIAGFLVARVVVDELHLLNIGVAARFRGRGLAHDLLHDFFNHAEKRHIDKLFLEVRESNQIAQRLYRKWGFDVLAKRRAYYASTNHKPREDALIMYREIEWDGPPNNLPNGLPSLRLLKNQ